MKVTKEKAAEHRETLVKTAARLFREYGIDGVGVAEISKQAGLTHGALYAQFPSKQALAAEALAYGMARANARMAEGDGHPLTLTDQLDYYMSTAMRDNLAMGCPMAASASEIARQDEAISGEFTRGYLQMVELIEAGLGEGVAEAERRPRALAIVAAMIGGIAVARATAKAQPALSADVVAAMRSALSGLGDEQATARRRKPAAPARAAPPRRRVARGSVGPRGRSAARR